MHKALFALAALSVMTPVGLLAQQVPPAPPRPTTQAPPSTSPPAARPAPASVPGSAGARIEFVKEPVVQTAPEPKTGDRPVCRGDVVDSCIQPGAARQQGR